jgi:hypothetical protein
MKGMLDQEHRLANQKQSEKSASLYVCTSKRHDGSMLLMDCVLFWTDFMLIIFYVAVW